MSNLAITSAPLLTGVNTASGDLFPLVDVSASAGSKGSAITRDELGDAMTRTAAVTAAFAAKLDKAGGTMTGALAVTPGTLATTGLMLAQTWNSPGVQCRGLEVAVTNTAAAATSTLFRVRGGAAGTTELFSVNGSGWLVGPATSTMVITPASGQNLNLYAQGGGSVCSVNIPLSFGDGFHLGFGTSSGTRIGTGTTQRIGFWNATPVVQQVLPTGSTTDQVITLLQTLGLCRQS